MDQPNKLEWYDIKQYPDISSLKGILSDSKNNKVKYYFNSQFENQDLLLLKKELKVYSQGNPENYHLDLTFFFINNGSVVHTVDDSDSTTLQHYSIDNTLLFLISFSHYPWDRYSSRGYKILKWESGKTEEVVNIVSGHGLPYGKYLYSINIKNSRQLLFSNNYKTIKIVPDFELFGTPEKEELQLLEKQKTLFHEKEIFFNWSEGKYIPDTKDINSLFDNLEEIMYIERPDLKEDNLRIIKLLDK
ncbi:MAG: hypothetical protein JW891_02960 [Candidatus Lokiarchaeota archaeon]|nr:hypothetical protein [Candidatus Lokiarchaeota archaeon]